MKKITLVIFLCLLFGCISPIAAAHKKMRKPQSIAAAFSSYFEKIDTTQYTSDSDGFAKQRRNKAEQIRAVCHKIIGFVTNKFVMGALIALCVCCAWHHKNSS